MQMDMAGEQGRASLAARNIPSRAQKYGINMGQGRDRGCSGGQEDQMGVRGGCITLAGRLL